MTEPPSIRKEPEPEPAEIDATVAHEARVYDYLLGGSVNFAVDREAAMRAAEAVGGIETARASVRGNRAFLGQAVRYLALEAGILQFLDIGTGIPNADNVHAVAQQAAPECRIVYVDNDPIVLAHAHALLKSSPEGATAFLQGDLRDPEDIVERAAATLDFSKPIAVMLVALLHHIGDDENPRGLVARLMAAVPSGSYLVMTHLASDLHPEEMAALAQSVPEQARYTFAGRTRAEFSRFFDGLELVDPGVVPIDHWRPGESPATHEGLETRAWHYGAVGRKP